VTFAHAVFHILHIPVLRTEFVLYSICLTFARGILVPAFFVVVGVSSQSHMCFSKNDDCGAAVCDGDVITTEFQFMIYCVRFYFIEPYFGSYYAAVDAPPPLLHRLSRQHREDMGRRLPSTARRAERPHEGSDVSCVRREREVLGVRWGGRGLTRVGTCFPAISRMLCRCCDAFKINCAFDDVAATANWYLRIKMLWWLWNELVLDGFAILSCDLKCHCCLKLAMNCVVM